MKKVRDLLLMLPDDLACKALNNFRGQRADRFHTLETDCISNAITSAFCWSDTPEGDQFWNPIYDKYAKIEFNRFQIP